MRGRLASTSATRMNRERSANRPPRTGDAPFGAPMTVRAARLDKDRRLMTLQERERTRLARELHDDIGQKLALIAIDVERLKQKLSDSGPDAQVLANVVLQAIVALGTDIQRLSHRLHSSKLDYLGLGAAARNFCSELSEQYRVTVDYVQDDVPDVLPHDVSLNLFRVLQEALFNAVRHSGTTSYQVKLYGTPDDVRLEVIDDGCGFDVESALRGHGLGVVSMRERLALVNGGVVIESDLTRGTRVRARVPYRRTPGDGESSTKVRRPSEQPRDDTAD